MGMIGMHCASLRDSLFAEVGLLANQPMLQARASHLFLRAAAMTTQLFDGDGTDPGAAVTGELVAGLADAAAAVSGDNAFDGQSTSDALDQAKTALDAVADAFGL